MPRQQIFAARLFSSRRSAEEFEGSTRCLDSSQLFRYWTPNGCSVSLLQERCAVMGWASIHLRLTKPDELARPVHESLRAHQVSA